MNSNEGVLISVANLKVSAAITTHVDLLPSAPASFLLAGNDITVGATRHASVQRHIQVPEGDDKVHIVIRSLITTVYFNILQYIQTRLYIYILQDIEINC